MDEFKDSILKKRLDTCLNTGRVPHALLLLGLQNESPFLKYMISALLCQAVVPPCEICQACCLASRNEHPDLHTIQPESKGKWIKIEEVRHVQSFIYRMPVLGVSRVVVIRDAEKMNMASSNALLKILEEPPDNTYFILLAENIGNILATVRSRCQLWRIEAVASEDADHFHLLNDYHPDSNRGKIFAQCETILMQLKELTDQKVSALTLAKNWSSFEFADLMWLLYLIHAEMISRSFLNEKSSRWPILNEIAARLPQRQLFERLDKINAILLDLNHNINRNELLLLEHLLMEF